MHYCVVRGTVVLFILDGKWARVAHISNPRYILRFQAEAGGLLERWSFEASLSYIVGF